MVFLLMFPCLFENTNGFLAVFLIDYLPLQIKPQAPNPVLTEEISAKIDQMGFNCLNTGVFLDNQGYLTWPLAVSLPHIPVGPKRLCLCSCGISVTMPECLRYPRASVNRHLNYLQSLL